MTRAHVATVGLLATAALLTSCDGTNRFAGPGIDPGGTGSDTSGPLVDIVTPSPDSVASRAVGDSVLVTVEVSDQSGVDSVSILGIARRGDPEFGTDQEVARFAPRHVELASQPVDTTISRYIQPTDDDTRERVHVVVTAWDAAGNVGVDTVDIQVGGEIGGPAPSVDILAPEAARLVRVGDTLRVRARIQDDSGLRRAILRGVGLRGDPTLGTDEEVLRFQPVTVEFGAGVTDTLLTRILDPTADETRELVLVIVEAEDLNGNLSADTVEVQVGDVEVPSVEVTTASSSLPVGDSLLVEASASDEGGLTSIRFVGRTRRGDPDLGTDRVVVRFASRTVQLSGAPEDTTVMRYLQPTADTVRETTWIVAEAFDGEGNVGRDSVPVALGGPRVEFVNLSAPVVGTDLPIQVRAIDPAGVSSIRVQITGAIDTVLVRGISPVQDTAFLDTLLAIPADAEGQITLVASAINSRNVDGSAGAVTLQIAQGQPSDETPPTVRMSVEDGERLEISDQVGVTVVGQDNVGGSGIVLAGVTIRAISQTRRDTLTRDTVVTYASPRSGTVTQAFSFTPFNVDPANLPDTLAFEVTSYVVDAEGNCAAVTEEGVGAPNHPCTETGDTLLAQGVSGLRLDRVIVSGRTVLLPQGGRILDAAVDTLRRELFLSNFARNRVEVFSLDDETFADAIGVGSEPWGLALVNDFTAPDPDSLIVANSGGTNMDVVDLPSRGVRRFHYPDVFLYDVVLELGETSVTVNIDQIPALDNLAFSDRPQFVAVDTFGNRIFSTVTVDPLEEIGTVRKSFFEEGWERTETKIFVEHAALPQADDAYAFAHIDNVAYDVEDIPGDTLGRQQAVLTVYDHVPGFPDQVITGTADISAGETPIEAWRELREQGSDVYMVQGASWSVSSVGFRDTTYVSASGDGTYVVVGEGARDPFGRVLLYKAAQLDSVNLTGETAVSDLITNRPEPVRGIGLNYDGTLGVVRGQTEVAFFDSNLRREGGASVTSGGAGAALHPLHADQATLNNPDQGGGVGGQHHPDTHLAFVGTGEGTIEIFDTYRFLQIGEVTIRDVVSGPLRAVLPFEADNAGLQCQEVAVEDRRGLTIGSAIQIYQNENFQQLAPSSVTDEQCIVVKLFGVTDAGGVAVVDVRKSDVLRFHPNR